MGGKLRNFSPMGEGAKRSTPYPQNDKSEHQRLVRSADRTRRRSRESTDRRRWPRAAARTYSTSASGLELEGSLARTLLRDIPGPVDGLTRRAAADVRVHY